LPGWPQQRNVARHGITWTFSAPMTVGEFANGDPWVLGPVHLVAIDPACAVVGDRTMHGAMVDPDPSTLQHGYDSALFGQWAERHYEPLRNAALGIGSEHPLVLQPGQSLVSIASTKAPDKNQPQIDVAAVLTCVDKPPPKDAFRPPYCKATAGQKKVRFREADLDWRVLPELKQVAGMPAADAEAAKFEKLWLDHFPSWVGRFAHPCQAMPDYGRDLAAEVSSAALLLCSKGTKTEKRLLLVRFVQFGIDCEAIVRNGGSWPGNGGHGSGRKFPILFAGTVLGDAAMANVGFSHPSGFHGPGAPNNSSWFGEDCQTFVVEETSPGVYNWGFGGYTAAHVGWPEWGNSHSEFQGNDHADWMADPYRRCCTANAWIGYCLAARIMGLVPAWNHQVFFDYEDRYQTFMTPGWQQAWESWHAAAWIQYRPLF
jgi:hypothetical protein